MIRTLQKYYMCPHCGQMQNQYQSSHGVANNCIEYACPECKKELFTTKIVIKQPSNDFNICFRTYEIFHNEEPINGVEINDTTYELEYDYKNNTQNMEDESND